ncbi:MAG TPA: NAD-dependent deacylase [Syntrophales bacterium]|nr:NAD-dependent deacylase [Syntrophales bacterium]
MADIQLDEKIRAVADMIVAAERVVVFTGAGVSTESGIPDFRSPGGIWSRFDPEDFTIERFLASAETRRKQWEILLDGGMLMDARPNKAHLAIAELEALGKLTCVITQNIDQLHQKAGNRPEKVFELHGNMQWLRCLGCDTRYPLDEMLIRYRGARPEVPVCERCRGILKPDAVFFGEALPEAALGAASYHARHCDVFLVVGSSLVVYPAAYMPVYAKGAGARLAIVNLSATLCDDQADILINETAGDVMERILRDVRARL